MLEPSEVIALPCDMVLNDIPVRSVQIRNMRDSQEDFEVVVTDRILGLFALHAGFEIDVREADSDWRRVSLDELKGMLTRNGLLAIGDLPRASEIAQCRLFARVDDIQIPH
jgi:hypothetical protein